jgi:hypothetical protein
VEGQHRHQLNQICVSHLNGFTGSNFSSGKGEAARGREGEWEGEGDLKGKFIVMVGSSESALGWLVLPPCQFGS